MLLAEDGRVLVVLLWNQTLQQVTRLQKVEYVESDSSNIHQLYVNCVLYMIYMKINTIL